MTRKTHRWHQWSKLPLAAAIAAGFTVPAQAFQFNLADNVEAAFDTTLSAGASWRMEDQNKNLIGQGNLAPLGANPNVGTTTGASSTNYDDGNLNFDKGDAYSTLVKGTSELLLNASTDNDTIRSVGGFTRVKYWYDFQLKDGEMATDDAGQQRQLNSKADGNASGGDLLDAYVFADLSIAETPVNLRAGRQVVSWGESTFIQGGINSINPIDVTAIRAPGAEVKEAFLPVNMVFTSVGVTDSVTVEGFYQLEWEKTEPDDCGTFFSTNDFTSDGCGPVILAGQLPDSSAISQGLVAPRVADDRPDDADQFGIALRWYAADWNETEFGLYFTQLHSRLPMISGVVNNPAAGVNLPSYYIEYPEAIKTYAFSASTTVLDGWSLGAEYSFRENAPLQWNAFELINAGVQNPSSLLYQDRTNGGTTSLAGQNAAGYDQYHVSQFQFTLIKFFDQIMGASRLTFLTEVGTTYVHDLPSTEEARYGRSGIMGMAQSPVPGAPNCSTNTSVNLNPKNCTDNGFTTDMSWGYRMRFALDYNDVFAGVNMTPTLAWSHDVSGYGPEPGANFIEGRQALGLGVRATYLNQYSAALNYNMFFGGEPYNDLSDRDNLNVSVSYSF